MAEHGIEVYGQYIGSTNVPMCRYTHVNILFPLFSRISELRFRRKSSDDGELNVSGKGARYSSHYY